MLFDPAIPLQGLSYIFTQKLKKKDLHQNLPQCCLVKNYNYSDVHQWETGQINYRRVIECDIIEQLKDDLHVLIWENKHVILLI